MESQQIAFIEMRYPPKMIVRASPTVEIARGHHNVRNVDGPTLDTDELVCLHAPLRSQATLEAKVKLDKRSEEGGRLPKESWHYGRWQ